MKSDGQLPLVDPDFRLSPPPPKKQMSGAPAVFHCRKCPLTAGFSNASFGSPGLRKGRRPISDLSLCGKKSRSWRRKGVVARASPRSCRCWKRAASETCKCEDRNQGWAIPSRSNCSDHSAGASRKLATPMPRGSRPSTAAFTRENVKKWNQGWARPSRSNCSDHSAGASRKLAMPMPRGSRPSTAALTRAGAMNAIDIVMLT